ncbi:MAG: 16S rRNA (cytosine(1402)-N(4))-methyltransferase RsmH [Acutalibacteraceae bacterium]|nr:16S rRNA (cytosine(1402)-N(4))-methyltransferase RsmH [Acutalibacteraceae bacterium]
MEFVHKSVLLNETIAALDIKSDGIYVDGTAGGAGHSSEIAKRLKGGFLYALDRDPDAVKTATERLKDYPAKVIESNFCDMASVLANEGVESVDGVLLDLGVSSYQLDSAERGFSYRADAPLDMRMSKSGLSAADIVNTYSVQQLTDIFRNYGEEKFAYKIANRIADEREKEPILNTLRLADIIASSVPAAARRDGHPARKCFQAIRIAVNGELEILGGALDSAFSLLKKDGVLAVITFHSLEDRIVKQKFKEYCTGCICPPDLPVCVCGRTPEGRLAFKKPIEASGEELNENPRSRSAKLRVIIKN